jgi:hypothetical protein
LTWVNRTVCLCLEGDDGIVRQRPGNLLLYLCWEGEKKRGQAAKACQSHKGNDLHPSDASASAVLAGVVRMTALKVGRATSKTANYRGVSDVVLLGSE